MNKSMTIASVAKRVTVIAHICAILSLLGCQQLQGVRYLQGDTTTIGVGLPLESGSVQVQAYSSLSGQRLEVDRKAKVTIDCLTASTNSYFGVVTTETVYQMRATITPHEESEQEATGD